MKSAATRALQAAAIAVFATLSLLAPATARAQEARGAITGTIRDASKGVVSGASVKITNVAMGTTVSVVTNSAGFFQALYLIPGTYQVVAENSGYKRYIREGIELRVNDTLEINIELEVGTMDQSITVTADTPTLETTTASMGKVVDSRRIAELPVGHGDPYALIGLAPGVTFTKSQRLDRPFEPTHIVGYAMDGTRSNRSDLTIDGAASTATANTGEVISTFVPPQDIVQEFKVQTATFDASLGNTEGGVTNLSIKSGTNQFHGTGSYSAFTPGTSANDFYDNRLPPLAGASERHITDFYYHRFGGTVGGPVWVPKIYKGENRTFFMYGLEGIREARPRNNGTFTIPTQKMRSGDFSDLLAIGPQYQLYNPFSARAVGARVQRDPFRCDSAGNPLAPLANKTQPAGTPCNKIPAGLINPIARAFVDTYLPLPTSAAAAADGLNNFQQPGLKERAIYYSHTIRLDHVFSDRHRTFGRASWYDRDSDYNNYYGNLATGTLFQFISRQGVIDHVYTLNATTVFNARYGYNRFIRVDNTNPENHGFDLASLGFPTSYTNLIPEDIRRFPRFNIEGYQGTGFGADFRPNDTHSIVGQVNKTLGVHSLKFGAEFRAYRENSFPTGNNQSGEFTFNNTYTKGPEDNSSVPTQLGFSFAALLLGIPSTGSINQPSNYAEQSTTLGLFVHNDWKVNSRLTLNLGLRWEAEGALTERYNRTVSGFDFNAAQAIEAAARAAFAAAQSNPNTATPEVTQFNVRGGLAFAGVNGESRGLYETPKKNFMPRIGLAYKLDEKTVVRAGYGIFFGFLGQRRGDIVQSGFSTTTPLVVTLNNGVSFVETLSNPFQSGLAAIPGASQGAQTFLGRNLGTGVGGNPTPGFFNPKPLSPYMQRWQLGFQRELGHGFVADVSYVGNRGTHIEIFRNINAVPNRFLTTNPTGRDQALVNYLSANVPNPFAGMTQIDPGMRGTNIARDRLLRPYPHFGDLWATTNEGYSWYHSLQLGAEKRFSKGYTVAASYTFSKFLEAIDLLNQGDPRPTEMISSEDRPHRLSVSGIYELPFGKGRPFLADAHPVASHFVSGWQVSAIYTLQSGPPLNFAFQGTTPLNIAYIGDPKDLRLSSDEQSLVQWINTGLPGFVALRNGSTAVLVNGQLQWVDFNDPCKTNPSCAKVLASPIGFNRDPNFQPDRYIRTFPARFGYLRGDIINNVDIGIMKKTFFGEKKELQFRAELLNAFNHPLLFTTQVNLNPAQAAFGQVTAGTQENYPRRVQMTFKFLF